MIYLYSDPHFGHKNILSLAKRPFSSIEDMDKTLIRNYNTVVKPEDDVYFLGDVGYKTNVNRVVGILRGLSGRKFLIKGNHDYKSLKNPNFISCFEWVKDYYELDYMKRTYVMFHYPIHSWNRMFRGSVCLFGHSHGKIKDESKLWIDVGVDNPVCAYAPISIDRIKSIMDARWKKINGKVSE